MGTRTADGRYPSRTAARIASIGGRTTRLAYRGWQAELPEPAILAVCTIADVPGAREFLSGRLGGKAMDAKALRAFAKSAGATKTEEWGVGVSPHVMQGAAPVSMIDGLASRFPTIRGARRSVVPMLGGSGDAGVMMICDDPSQPGCDDPAIRPHPHPRHAIRTWICHSRVARRRSRLSRPNRRCRASRRPKPRRPTNVGDKRSGRTYRVHSATNTASTCMPTQSAMLRRP